MTQILKRLEIIKSSIAIEELEIIEQQTAKLQTFEIDEDVRLIIRNLEDGAFSTAITLIQNYLTKFSGVVIYVDSEVQGLKLELKSLESKLQNLIEQKTEYLSDIEEFNNEYNLHLGELIKAILSLKKEMLYKKIIKQHKQKAKYQENLQTFEETKETIEELKNTIAELEEALESIDEDDENYEELIKAHKELQEEIEILEKELENQEEELEKTKEFIEDETIEEEYEEAKTNFDEYENEYKQTKENQKDVMQLSDDEKIELKKLFKKAARLCHPDIVPDEFKEKATQMMQQLNDAYSKKDLKKIKEILSSLENGTVFEFASDKLEDKIKLQEKIKEYKQNIKDIEDEIARIMEDDTYQTISGLDDWDEYFEELKSDLEAQKEELEEKARGILKEKEEEISQISQIVGEEIPEWIQKIWDWANENNISNEHLSRKKENLLAKTNIDFTGMKLKNIPQEICYLENITTLTLWDNDLIYLPQDIVKFVNLTKLNLRGNPNLTISSTQQEWINNLSKKCTVFIDDVKLYRDDYDSSNEKLYKNELTEQITQTILTNFKNEYSTDLSTNYQIMLRIKDEAKKSANELMHNGEAKFALSYVTFLNNKPVNIEKVFKQERFGLAELVSEKIVKNEHKPVHPSKEKEIKIVPENTSYSKYIQSIDVPNFEKIRRYCNNLADENKADEMQKYLAENGKMHKALIYDALEQFISQLNGKNLTLVEWGCEQGIASMLVLDYIREKQLDIEVAKVILIEDDTKALSRAMAHNQVFVSKSAEIFGFDSKDKTLSTRLKNSKDSNILHIFANDTMPMKFKDVEFESIPNSYFMCISSVNSAFLAMVHSEISALSKIKTLSSRDGQIGNYERFERIFQMNNTTNDIDDEYNFRRK